MKEQIKNNTSWKTRKLKRVSEQKFSRRVNKLIAWAQKPHFQLEILAVSFYATAIFFVFSFFLLFSVNLIDRGGYLMNSQIFYNNYTPSTSTHVLVFGIYQYTFSITSATGNNILSLATGKAPAIAKIIGTMVGPNLTWFGVLFVVFQALVFSVVSFNFALFRRAHKVLKYDKLAAKTRRYFNAVYGSLITLLILGGVIVYLNVIPGKAVIEPLLAKFAPQFHYPALNGANTSATKASAKISAVISQYLADLKTNGPGVVLPVAVFTLLKLRVLTVNGTEYLSFDLYSAYWAWIVFAVLFAWLIVLFALKIKLFTEDKKMTAHYQRYQLLFRPQKLMLPVLYRGF